MNDRVRPVPEPSLAPNPDARNDIEEAESAGGEPGTDENAAGFLKHVIHKPAEG